MAASRGVVPEQDSSSEDEDHEKFKEATWNFGPTGTNVTHHNNSADGKASDKPSRRVRVSQHDHDGNELQTTPEFKAHVAKKLKALLDNCISESSSPVTADTCNVLPVSTRDEDGDEEEEGFKLFSTSIPGPSVKQPSPPPPRHRIPSSSDSDSEMEMRFREAAVSVADLLPPSLLPSMLQSLSSPAPPSTENKTKKKKKKKKKKEREKSENENEGRESREEGEIVENGSLDKKKKRKRTEGGRGTKEETERNSRDSLHRKNKMEEQRNTEEESFSQIGLVQEPLLKETAVKKKKKRKSKREGEG